MSYNHIIFTLIDMAFNLQHMTVMGLNSCTIKMSFSTLVMMLRREQQSWMTHTSAVFLPVMYRWTHSHTWVLCLTSEARERIPGGRCVGCPQMFTRTVCRSQIDLKGSPLTWIRAELHLTAEDRRQSTVQTVQWSWETQIEQIDIFKEGYIVILTFKLK